MSILPVGLIAILIQDAVQTIAGHRANLMIDAGTGITEQDAKDYVNSWKTIARIEFMASQKP